MQLEVTLDCNDLDRLADFWSAVLGRVRGPVHADNYVSLEPRESGGFVLTLQRVGEPKSGKNRMHLDLLVEDVDAEAARIEALGATRVASEPFEAYGQRWFVLADPEGNEFCLGRKPGP